MLPPPRLAISPGEVGTSFADGIGGLAMCRANCGAAALVPLRRNTAPLRVPPARIPPRAYDSSQGSRKSGPGRRVRGPLRAGPADE